MLLNSILMNLQGQVNGVRQTAENPDAVVLDGEPGSSESDFSMLIDQFGLSTENGLDEQELTALLADFVEQTGEILPQGEGAYFSPVSFEVESEDGFDREQLLAFLMANASQELPSEVKEALNNLPFKEEAVSSIAELDEAFEEPAELSPLMEAVVDETDVVEPVSDETAIAPDLINLTKEGAQSSVNSEDELAKPLQGVEQNDLLDDAIAVEPTVDEAPLANAESNQMAGAGETEELLEVDDVMDYSGMDSSPVETSATDVTAASEAAAAPAAATVVVGEIKNQLSDANRLSPLSAATSVTANSEETTVSAKLQSAIQNQLSTSESVAEKTDPLVSDSMQAKSNADDVASEAEVDIERALNAQLSPSTHRGSEKPASPAVNSQLLADQLNRPVRLANAHQALTERITTMVSNEIKQAVIQLDPAELGHLEIRLHIQNEQTQVQIVASTAQSRDALEQQAARLRESFNAQGLNLSQLDVSDQSAQQFQGEGGESRGDQAHQDGEFAEPLETEQAIQQTVGLVNHFV